MKKLTIVALAFLCSALSFAQSNFKKKTVFKNVDKYGVKVNFGEKQIRGGVKSAFHRQWQSSNILIKPNSYDFFLSCISKFLALIYEMTTRRFTLTLNENYRKLTVNLFEN